MDIKKTDVFGGIGVLAVQLIIQWIGYAFKKNNLNLVIGFLFAIVISFLLVTIWILRRKLKELNKNHIEQAEYLKQTENNLTKRIEQLTESALDMTHEIDILNQEIEKLEQDLELFNNKCAYYISTDTVNKKILYSLKHNKNYDTAELQALISEIEYIFRDDVFSKTAKMNTSIFAKNPSDFYSILLSTKHSPGTIKKLKLDKKSLVGVAFNEKRVIYCGDIDNRKPDIPFVELDRNRKYQSILAIPLIIDDSTEFVMVITCTNRNCLEETYNKYQDVIQRYLELLCILLFISSDKEELR